VLALRNRVFEALVSDQPFSFGGEYVHVRSLCDFHVGSQHPAKTGAGTGTRAELGGDGSCSDANAEEDAPTRAAGTGGAELVGPSRSVLVGSGVRGGLLRVAHVNSTVVTWYHPFK
jgi:hypothetical protein